MAVSIVRGPVSRAPDSVSQPFLCSLRKLRQSAIAAHRAGAPDWAGICHLAVPGLSRSALRALPQQVFLHPALLAWKP